MSVGHSSTQCVMVRLLIDVILKANSSSSTNFREEMHSRPPRWEVNRIYQNLRRHSKRAGEEQTLTFSFFARELWASSEVSV